MSSSAIDHYENFPVASWLCPAHLRSAIAAIYHFARTADDIADEGDASPAERLADLQAYRLDLRAACHAPDAGAPPLSERWRWVFEPLQRTIAARQLPVPLLHDLLDAFVQDIQKSAAQASYQNQTELQDYCRRSANPVGRLLLHLYGVVDALALQRSDAICSALQLINFWQDLSVDIPRGRYYLPDDDCVQFGVLRSDMLACKQTPDTTLLIAHLAMFTRARMAFGLQLVHQVPGRAGWELRLVVQGGLRILDKIDALHYATLSQRPTLRWWDFPVMLWRAAWM